MPKRSPRVHHRLNFVSHPDLDRFTLTDGETGERSGWIGFQINAMQRPPQLGLIPAGVRFQVSLPTPLAPVIACIEPAQQVAIEPAYEARLLAEMDDIRAAIPHHRLAIQYDTAVEFALFEGVWPSFLTGRPDIDLLHLGLRRSCTWAWCIAPMGLRERVGAWPPPARRYQPSASQPSAAWAIALRRPFTRSSSSTLTCFRLHNVHACTAPVACAGRNACSRWLA